MRTLTGEGVVGGRAGGVHAGPFVQLWALCDEGEFVELSFETFGCPAAIASGAVLCESLAGRSLSDARSWDIETLLTLLGGLPRQKRYCAELAIDALTDLLAAINTE